MLEGLAVAVLEKGYAATTIADIARLGRVSKSAIYEHFSDKEDAFIALHQAITLRILERIIESERATAQIPDWRERVRCIVRGYIDAATTEPTYLPLALVEAATVSPRARASQQAAHDRFAERLQHMSRDLARDTPQVRPLTRELALGAVGALNELVVRAAPGGPSALRRIEGPAGEILQRFLYADGRALG
ncbi:MAG TPA: TetR/AcrR family transcriptional regulator [Solirubrobacteraceae bacterium]|nr:TetR/AcrR family transcriptional regulator [Solirubrobacteraceae bacterium]